MIQFASPLPHNYDKIVSIFAEPYEPCEVAATEKRDIVCDIVCDPPFSPCGVCDFCMKPKPGTLEAIPEDKTLDAKMVTAAAQPPSLPNDPFVEKPLIIAPTLKESELLEASPGLSGDYLQQRQTLQELRASTMAEPERLKLKKDELDVKTEPQPQSIADVPPTIVEETKQTFAQQQELLRKARADFQANMPEKKQDAEKMLDLPPPNIKTKPVVVQQKRPRALTPTSDAKQQREMEQQLPPPNVTYPIESLRLDQLKQQCIQHGLSSKGNKPDLVVRLRANGVSTVSF